MSVADFRSLASPQNPFLLGQYPDRPSPTHVLNGFVASSLGVSPRGAAIRELIASDQPPPRVFEYITGADWASDPGVLAAFRSDLSLVYNPNRRMWGKIGSPVPVDAHFATSDPSDDRFGPMTWQLVESRLPKGCKEDLKNLLLPEVARDPVTACARILTANAEEGPTRTISIGEQHWFGAGASRASGFLADRLAQFVAALIKPRDDARRLSQIQHLGRAVYLATMLAILLGPAAAVADGEVESVDEIGSLVVWGGMPPGHQDHPVVMASARSLQLAIDGHRAGVAQSLKEALEAQPIPTELPSRQRRRAALTGQLIGAGLTVNRTDELINRLRDNHGVTVEGSDVASDAWINSLLNATYTADHLTRGFRSMGWKLGLIGPDRGNGTPRFLCETPLLATIVEGLCSADGMDFEEFIDLARERLGLILGVGTDDGLGERLGLWEGAGVARRLLRDNQEQLRRRLLRSGLAREYSDSHTEVLPYG